MKNDIKVHYAKSANKNFVTEWHQDFDGDQVQNVFSNAMTQLEAEKILGMIQKNDPKSKDAYSVIEKEDGWHVNVSLPNIDMQVIEQYLKQYKELCIDYLTKVHGHIVQNWDVTKGGGMMLYSETMSQQEAQKKLGMIQKKEDPKNRNAYFIMNAERSISEIIEKKSLFHIIVALNDLSEQTIQNHKEQRDAYSRGATAGILEQTGLPKDIGRYIGGFFNPDEGEVVSKTSKHANTQAKVDLNETRRKQKG